MSRVIHATQTAKASPKSMVGKKASAAAQNARKSSQREAAMAKREGTEWIGSSSCLFYTTDTRPSDK